MRFKSQHLLKLPTFSDPEETRLAGWIQTYLITAVVVALLLLPIVVTNSVRVYTSVGINTIFIATHFLAWVLLRNKLIQPAKKVLITSFFILSVSLLFLYNGIRGMAAISFFVLITVVSLLGNTRTITIVTSLSVLLMTMAYFAEQTGLIQADFIPQAVPIHLVLLLAAMGTNMLIQQFINISYAEKEVQLQQAHNQLEQRVAERTVQLTRTNNLLSQEIKEHQLSVTALQKSEAIWRSMAVYAPNIIITIDLGYNILYFNHPQNPILDNLSIGDSIFDIQLHESCHTHMRDYFANMPNDELFGTFEAKGIDVNKDASFICRIGPILQGVKLVSFILILTDVSEQKKADELLRHTTKMESLGILAGGVAHDFNNLLVGIMGQSSIAQVKMETTHPARVHVDKAIKASERAAHLTKQMLAYSGKDVLRKRAFNLNALIEENIDLFQTAVSSEVKLKAKLDPNLPLIEGDVNQLQQVIMNLILNGAEAIEQTLGTVQIHTKLVKIDGNKSFYWKWTGRPLPPGQYVQLEVHDNGKGMDDDMISKIFDPFYTTKFTGRGLGLAAVIGIVRSHKGGIAVYSSVNTGTTFRIVLPVFDDPKQADMAIDESGETVPTSGQVVSLQTNATILVIDDEKAVRETAADMLKNAGITTVFASDGQAGIDIYKQKTNQIDLILLDITMPGLNGNDIWYALRELNEDIPIILSSGYNEKEIVSQFANGKDSFKNTRFLAKPYRLSTLLKMIQELIFN